MNEITTIVQLALFVALVCVAVATIIMPFAIIAILRCLRRMEVKLKEMSPYAPAIWKAVTSINQNVTREP